MKKASDAKYPSSASLFQFCRLVLDHKFGGIRVIDQDVGQILGFDPADCSHWKKGKKSIRSIQAMKSIAQHLGVDERLVVDVASGDLDEHEAFFEFNGYGAFDIDPKLIENAKKDFYRKNASTWSRDREAELKAFFDLQEPLIDEIVKDIHKKINFIEAPLYIPELIAAQTDISLQSVDDTGEDQGPISVEDQGNKLNIKFKAGLETRPNQRFKIAKTIGDFLLKQKLPTKEPFADYGTHVRDIQSNLFAAKLLAPAQQIRQEMTRLNVAKDIVVQLADTFWVSKGFMNRRLKDILERQPAI